MVLVTNLFTKSKHDKILKLKFLIEYNLLKFTRIYLLLFKTCIALVLSTRQTLLRIIKILVSGTNLSVFYYSWSQFSKLHENSNVNKWNACSSSWIFLNIYTDSRLRLFYQKKINEGIGAIKFKNNQYCKLCCLSQSTCVDWGDAYLRGQSDF